MTIKNTYNLFLGVTFVLMVTSCTKKQFISNDQYFLKKFDINITDEIKHKESKKLIADLKTIIIQKSKYEKGDKNIFQRIFTRPRKTIYNRNDTEKSVSKMQSFLRNNAYFDVLVNSEENVTGIKEMEVTYKVTLSKKYVVKKLTYQCDNNDILKILNDNIKYSFLKRSVAIEQSYCDQEKLRITELLNDNGYAQFTPNYVDVVELDTSNFLNLSDNIIEVNCAIQILNPLNNRAHQKYKIGKISVDPNYNPSIKQEYYKDSLINNISYIMHKDEERSGFLVDPQTINTKIKLNEGSIYNKQNLNQTKKDLSRLEIYSFINVKNEVVEDSIQNIINYQISLSPQKSKSINGGMTANYSSIGPTGGQIDVFGISGNIGFINRNALRGAEQLSLNISAGIDFKYSSNIGLNMTMSYPKYVDGLFNVMRLYKKMGLIKNNFYQNLINNAATQISGSVNYFSLKNFYDYVGLDLNYGYRLNSKNTQYKINRTGFSVFIPSIFPKFSAIIDSNEFLKRSYEPQLSTGFLIKEINLSKINYLDINQSSNSLKINVEQSGAEVFAINKLFSPTDTFRLGKLNFAQFLKLEVEYLKAHYFNHKHGIIGRLGLGLATAYGNSKVVPFNEQLFLGGPNSLRAWRIRGVGPGSFKDPNPNSNNIQSQTGDFKLEASLEYRFPIFKMFKTVQVEGALFVDAGNIWTINDKENPSNQWFNSDFTKQIAIGSGTGIRIDFNYFLFRVDLGLRMRNPYIETNTEDPNFGLYRTFSKLSEVNHNLLNWIIAFDYPF